MFLRGTLAAFFGFSMLAACTPATAPGDARGVATVAEPSVGHAQQHLRLISQDQYANTIASIFGTDLAPALNFAPFERTDGLLATGAAYQGLTGRQVESYQRAAGVIAARVVSAEHRDVLVPCKPLNEKAADAACATKFITRTGGLLFRRPLSGTQLDALVATASAGADRLKNFYAGLALAIEPMLVSPQFLYIDEVAEPDPGHPGKARLDNYSLAARLSFFLWNQGPDENLLNVAARGVLYDPKQRARIVDVMLSNSKAELGVRAFFSDMLGFDDFANLAKDPNIYPAFTGQAVVDAREQSLRLIVDQLIRKNGDYRDLFTTRETFIAPSLAMLYRVPLPKGGWNSYKGTPDDPRVGLLTQFAFLSLHAHPGRTSPTRRGKALRELLLCQKVPPPPPNVDFSALENPDPKLKTARDRLTVHQANPLCAGCHRITDPIGLALENFDGAGEYREAEGGAPIDASGNLDGKEFKNSAELGQVLHEHPGLPSCLVRRVYAYAVGGRLNQSGQPLMDYFNQRFAAGGYRLPELLRTIALSASFSAVETDARQQASAQ